MPARRFQQSLASFVLVASLCLPSTVKSEQYYDDWELYGRNCTGYRVVNMKHTPKVLSSGINYDGLMYLLTSEAAGNAAVFEVLPEGPGWYALKDKSHGAYTGVGVSYDGQVRSYQALGAGDWLRWKFDKVGTAPGHRMLTTKRDAGGGRGGQLVAGNVDDNRVREQNNIAMGQSYGFWKMECVISPAAQFYNPDGQWYLQHSQGGSGGGTAVFTMHRGYTWTNSKTTSTEDTFGFEASFEASEGVVLSSWKTKLTLSYSHAITSSIQHQQGLIFSLDCQARCEVAEAINIYQWVLGAAGENMAGAMDLYTCQYRCLPVGNGTAPMRPRCPSPCCQDANCQTCFPDCYSGPPPLGDVEEEDTTVYEPPGSCASMKADYKESGCCGAPARNVSHAGSAMSCGDLKAKWKQNRCCPTYV